MNDETQKKDRNAIPEPLSECAASSVATVVFSRVGFAALGVVCWRLVRRRLACLPAAFPAAMATSSGAAATAAARTRGTGRRASSERRPPAPAPCCAGALLRLRPAPCAPRLRASRSPLAGVTARANCAFCCGGRGAVRVPCLLCSKRDSVASLPIIGGFVVQCCQPCQQQSQVRAAARARRAAREKERAQARAAR